MIRRRENGSFWLITQQAHAELSGTLARAFGNAQFARPEPYEQTIQAIANHDCGWHIHDDAPTLFPAKIPLDVFETPRTIAHKVWLESAKRAAAIDPYTGLLVTLHQLALSANSVSTNQPSRFDVQQLRQQFDLNKFQHQMIELVENLRSKVGLRTDKPLRLGLSDGWSEPAEEQLKYNFRLLQAMDILSLAICSETFPDKKTGPLHTQPASPTVTLEFTRPNRAELRVSPWPFNTDELHVNVPYRSVPERTYSNADELAATLSKSRTDQFEVALTPLR